MRSGLQQVGWLSALLFSLPVRGASHDAPQPQDESYRYQYAAKIVCATGREDVGLGIVPQASATTINIHNPADSLAVIAKKLALTMPPGAERPGKIIPLTRVPEQLRPDEAMATDCVDVARRAAIRPAFEGFVVLYSSVPLDVVGVYTVPGGIDIVPVAERRRHLF